MPNKPEITTPVPEKEAVPPREKLLNESMTGAQALMILGQPPPEPGQTIPRLTRNLITEAAKKIPSQHGERINRASFNERDEFWKGKSFDEAMAEWKTGMNAFLDPIKKEPARTTELTFLKKLLREDDKNNLDEVEVTPDTIYSTFMQNEGKGDVEFFARRIADNNTREEIEQNKDLIKKLGKIYGRNSAKIAELLTHGIFNAKKNPVDFCKSAQKNLDESNYGDVIIWADLDKNSKEWEKKEYEKEKVLFQRQEVIQKPSEKTEISKELHPLVEEAGGETKKGDKTEESPNQDDFFIDPKHGAFGVFDGLGSLTYSADASKTAKTYIEQALSCIDENLDLETTKKQVEQVLIGANKAVREGTEARYQKMKNDLEKNLTGQLPDKELEEIYEKEYPSVIELLKSTRDKLRSARSNKMTDEQDDELWHKAVGDTTASVVKLWKGKIGNEEKKKAIIGNVGDSRVYLLHEGKLEAMTIDDNPLYLIVGNIEAKRLQDERANSLNKSGEKLYGDQTVILEESNLIHKELHEYALYSPKKYPFKNGKVEVPYSEINDVGILTLGEKTSRQKMQSIDVASGDRILLTTDGVHDGLLNKEMEKILKDSNDSDRQKVVKALIDLAYSRGNKVADDMTAVVINIK